VADLEKLVDPTGGDPESWLRCNWPKNWWVWDMW
jgi:hypothetical protein